MVIVYKVYLCIYLKFIDFMLIIPCKGKKSRQRHCYVLRRMVKYINSLKLRAFNLSQANFYKITYIIYNLDYNQIKTVLNIILLNGKGRRNIVLYVYNCLVYKIHVFFFSVCFINFALIPNKTYEIRIFKFLCFVVLFYFVNDFLNYYTDNQINYIQR